MTYLKLSLLTFLASSIRYISAMEGDSAEHCESLAEEVTAVAKSVDIDFTYNFQRNERHTIDTIPATEQAPGMSVWWRTFNAIVDDTPFHWITMGGMVASTTSAPSNLSDGQYVMQYFSREDISAPGNYQTWTCTAKYVVASLATDNPTAADCPDSGEEND